MAQGHGRAWGVEHVGGIIRSNLNHQTRLGSIGRRVRLIGPVRCRCGLWGLFPITGVGEAFTPLNTPVFLRGKVRLRAA